MSTCSTLIDALNTVASYTTPSNVLGDLSGQIATLSPITDTNQVLQLSSGGNATITVPSSSIDGKIVKVSFSGYVSKINPSGSNGSPSFFVGIGDPSNNTQLGTFSTSATQGFFTVFTFTWNSNDNKMIGTGIVSNGATFNSQTISPFSGNFPLYIAGYDAQNSNNLSFVCVEFKAELE